MDGSGGMVDRVARAIEIAIVERTMHHPVSKELPKLKWLWDDVARDVIEEMREPTFKMALAGSGFNDEDATSPDEHLRAVVACEAREASDTWRDMIDEALK